MSMFIPNQKLFNFVVGQKPRPLRINLSNLMSKTVQFRHWLNLLRIDFGFE